MHDDYDDDMYINIYMHVYICYVDDDDVMTKSTAVFIFVVVVVVLVQQCVYASALLKCAVVVVVVVVSVRGPRVYHSVCLQYVHTSIHIHISIYTCVSRV